MNFRLEDPKATLKADVPWTVFLVKRSTASWIYIYIYGFA